VPKPGDILLVHSTDLQSRLIQIGTRSFWNHVAIAVSADALVEALGGGVAASPVAKYDGRPEGTTRWIDTGRTDDQRALAVAYARSRVGRRYNKAEIASIALGILTGWHFVFGVSGEDICSGLVGEAMERAGATFPKEGTDLTPADLAAFYAVVPRLGKL
jgi:hypothetical protein